MKVVLVKEDMVDFNLQDEKCEKISHNLFRSLTGYRDEKPTTRQEPLMVVFKTKEEYQEEAWKYDLDLTKDVLINTKGNIFCYLKDETNPIKSQSEENTDVTTDTQENKGE